MKKYKRDTIYQGRDATIIEEIDHEVEEYEKLMEETRRARRRRVKQQEKLKLNK